MSITYDNYLGKLVLNTNDARIEGKQYVWDNVNLPVVNIADKSVIDVESCFKNGGLSNLVSRQIAMSNLSPPLMHTGYGFSNMYALHSFNVDSSTRAKTDWIYFQTSNNSPYYRFKFSSNVPTTDIARLDDFQSSTNGTSWMTVSSGFPTALTSNDSILPITEYYLNLIDVHNNSNAVLRPARFWFALNNTYLPAASGTPNDYATFFADYGLITYMYFYIPSTNTYARLRWTSTANASIRATNFWTSSNGGLSWTASMTGIPFAASGFTTPCDCFVIERSYFPVLMYNGGTVINLTNFTNPTSYDSTTKNHTEQFLTLPSPWSSSGRFQVNHSLYYQTVAKPIMFNFNKLSFPIRLSISPTLDRQKEYFLPYGDNLQLTLKLFKYDEKDAEEIKL